MRPRVIAVMLCLLFCVVCLIAPVTCIQCMSSAGKPVDWYIVYKLPKISESPDQLVQDGYGHFYMDVDDPTWRLSTVSMNATKHAVAYTLQPIFERKKSDDFMYFMYNDEDPNKKEPERFGHSKGVVAFGKASGYWLVHSTPRFPPFKETGYYWPDTARIYGQSFLCVSYNIQSLDTIAGQILMNYVQVYSQYVPDSFLSLSENLKKITGDTEPTGPPWTSLAPLTSIQGSQFTSFAKYRKFYKELYEDWVAPTLKSDLLTETWLNGKGKLPSNCSLTHKVFNVKKISLPSGIYFENSRDHSKWAVSMPGIWVCIGDINREKSQSHRGGGTVCMQNKNVWNQFMKAITVYEKC